MGGCARGGTGLARARDALAAFLLLACVVPAFLPGSVASSPVRPAITVSISVNPSNLTAGGTAEFTSTVSGVASLAYVHYNWSFGDGTLPFRGLGPRNSSTFHVYSNPGIYVASVNASEQGAWANQSISVYVGQAPISIVASATPGSGAVPLTVDFEVEKVAGGTESYTSILWKFGDGHEGTAVPGTPLPYTYTSGGTFRARVFVNDTAGDSGTELFWINATAPSPPPPSPWSEALSTWVPWATTVAAVLIAVAALYRARSAPRREERAEERLAREAARSQPSSKVPRSATAEPTAPGAPPRAGPEIGSEEREPVEGPPPPAPSTPPVEVTPALAPPGEAVVAEAPVVAPTTESSPQLASPVAPPEETPRPVEPEKARPSPRRPRPKVAPATLKLSLRIVVHIASQGALGPHDVAPAGLTQAGMAEVLGTTQNTIATLLKRLEVGGMIVSDVRHVRGGARRMKVYRLTTRGEALAREVRSRPAPARASSGDGDLGDEE